MFYDTHAHLDDDAFDAGRDDVILRARGAGVACINAVGTTAASSERCARIAEKYDGVYATAGIHPNYCHEAQPGDWERVVKLLDHPRVVALGETGLDRYWDYAPFELQQDYCDRHLRLSQERDVAFIVHMRDCAAEIWAMLEDARRRGPLRGVMHSFTGDEALARQCLGLGLYISFAGMVTFKKSDELRSVAAMVPEDRILIETDAPYLSPHPLRGKSPNEPARVIHTAACLAEVRGVSLDRFAQQTTANARRLFEVE
jgi:TatD DNase family protein